MERNWFTKQFNCRMCHNYSYNYIDNAYYDVMFNIANVFPYVV